MTLMLAAVYADGWDDAVVNPLTRTAAEARDAAGEPYSVVLLRDGRRHAVIDISWVDGYCHVSRYDEADRQISRHELRRTPDGDLFLRRARTWVGPPDVGVHEFPHVAARHSTTYRLAGGRTDIDEPQGDRGSRSDTSSAEFPPRLPVPAFGRWRDLLALVGDGDCEIVEADGHSLPVRSATVPPWQPPRPLTPDDVEELFRAGTERPIDDRRMRLSTHSAGTLRLPSGRLVATDPGWLKYDNVPFTVTVPPGDYPVTISLATFVDEPDHRRVAAARLDITDRPVVGWELALRDGQEPLDLGAGEFFGFGVDAGLACFADAGTYDRIPDLKSHLDAMIEPRYRVIGDGELVAWSSGWGDGAYPTWIGRDADGDVVCFVADMLLFYEGEDEEGEDEED
ncbi:DUF4241 domain-containing protein [Plantactinospora sonchi]|uniref:DUF4241 domain-containing protein n=1 Tax=Plantactinospora sonchi TaxID=1544735 RepID=A0ABU7RNK6_9ACTN